MPQKTVLITGCSDGGLGAALAVAFKERDYRVIASARNLSKLSYMKEHGIECIQLDVTDESSVKDAVVQVQKLLGGKLDMLVNNAGQAFPMPVIDMELAEYRKMFELNFLSIVTMTREFLPLLRAAENGTLVNHTSTASVIGVPWRGGYAASKAAAASLTQTLRLELSGFGIKVVDIKTGMVRSRISANASEHATSVTLPPNSAYNPGREAIEKNMQADSMGDETDASVWARQVVKDLSKSHPPLVIYRGASAWLVQLSTWLPITLFDSMLKQMTGLATFEQKLKEEQQSLKKA